MPKFLLLLIPITALLAVSGGCENVNNSFLPPESYKIDGHLYNRKLVHDTECPKCKKQEK